MSSSGSSALTMPVTVPMAVDVFVGVPWPLIGAALVVGFGAMVTLTGVVVLPPNPSLTVMVTVSVLVADVAAGLDAASRAAAVGV